MKIHVLTRCLTALLFTLMATGLQAQDAARPPGVDAVVPRSAAAPVAAPVATPVATPSPDADDPAAEGVAMDTDRLEYDAERKMLIGVGNVVVTYGNVKLSADYAEVNTATYDGYAKGNVVLEQPGSHWKGEELRGNLKTRQFDFGQFKMYSEPFYLSAEDSKRVGPDTYELHNASWTTCEGEKPGFQVKAKHATVTNKQHVKAKGAVVYMGGIPVFYWPYLKKNLSEKKSNIDVVPGYSSRLGAFLLTSYNYKINEQIVGATKLDIRSKRGLGVGQDFRWRDREKTYRGMFRAYYANDQEPLESVDEDEQDEFADQITADRYRLKLSHNQTFTPRDYAIAEFNYLSDPLILTDFFDEEYRYNAQPENRVTYTHRDDRYTFNAEVSKRLNDFYDNLDRQPELSADFARQQIGDTPLFYEGVTSLSSLEQVFREGSTKEDYRSGRFDTFHRVVYPTRSFGWLNLTPRAGGRVTYYTDTRSILTTTNLVSSVDTNGFASVDEEVSVTNFDMGADTRTLLDLGLDTSFKAFGVIHDRPTAFGRGLRHVVEPLANYSYIPEPSLLPEDLYQFDNVDKFVAENQVRLGLRNKLQTKKGGTRVHDLVDFLLFVDYYLDPDEGEDNYGPMAFDLELRPSNSFMIDSRAAYDFNASTMDELSVQAGMFAQDRSNVNVEYRYRDLEQSLLAGEVRLFPKKAWSFAGYWRYEFETGDLEEHSYSIIRKTDCLGYGLGIKQIGDDVTVWGQIWLTALPQTAVELGR